jgi:TPR repeat protein
LMQIGAVYASGEIGPRNEALAARWYQAALSAGFVKAAEILAEYYRTGFGVEQSSSKYIEYLTRAAEAGLPSAMLQLGSVYVQGELLPQDRKKAQMWLDGAVRGGRLDGLKWLVRMFSGEYGGYVEESATIRYGEMMVERGTATALEKLLLGRLYTTGRPESLNRQRGLALLEEAAALEEGRAARLLGDLYLSGQGGEKDLSKAMRYFRQAALLGDVVAMDVVSNVLQCTQQAEDTRPVAKFWRNAAAFAGSGSARRRHADELFDANNSESAKSRARLYRAAALEGDREAAAIVAFLYRRGEGLPASQEGYDYFIAQALRPGEGIAAGYVALAQVYLEGKLAPVDVPKAIALLREAAALQDGRAHFELSRVLASTGLEEEGQTLNHLRQSADLGYPAGMRALGLRLAGEARELGRTRAEWLRAAAKAGDMKAAIELARGAPSRAEVEAALDVVWDGQSCDPSHMLDLALAYASLKTATATSKAYLWLRRAETYGNGGANFQFSLGTAYLKELGVYSDPQKAETYLRRAHELGHPRAIRRLASAYLEGLITSGDPNEARRILKEAAEQGHVDAALELVENYVRTSPPGPLPAATAEKVQRLFALVMPQSVEAAREYGILILKGRFAGIGADTAIPLIRRAAEAGDTLAMRELGNAYASGMGVARQPDQFIRWITRAATNGDPEAMYKLSAAYESGFGVEPNLSEAERWIREARRAGAGVGQIR